MVATRRVRVGNHIGGMPQHPWGRVAAAVRGWAGAALSSPPHFIGAVAASGDERCTGVCVTWLCQQTLRARAGLPRVVAPPIGLACGAGGIVAAARCMLHVLHTANRVPTVACGARRTTYDLPPYVMTRVYCIMHRHATYAGGYYL